MASFPKMKAPLSDGEVTLRPSAERDIPEVLIAYQDDPGLAAALGEGRPPTGAALGRRAERAEAEWGTGRSMVLSIVESGAEVCLGEVRIAQVDWPEERAEIRVWVAAGRRGQGLGRRAHHLARDWLKAYCGLEAVCPKEE